MAGLLDGVDPGDELLAEHAPGLLHPFTAAALRQRVAMQPFGGRQPGAMTTVADRFVPHVIGSVPHALENIATLPQRSLQASENYRATGEYDPVFLEAALTPMMGAMPFAQRGAVGGFGGKPPSRPTLPPAPVAQIKSAGRMPARVAPFEEFGEIYPPVGPRQWMVDSRTGLVYPAKKLLPVVEDMQAASVEFRKAMEKEGYKPYFDLAKQEYVDPTNYSSRINTLDIVPKTPATFAKYWDIIGSAQARQRLDDASALGRTQPHVPNMMANKQLEDFLIRIHGGPEGRMRFANNAASVAATTAGADLSSNFLASHYADVMRARGLTLPTESYQLPYPIGGRLWSTT